MFAISSLPTCAFERAALLLCLAVPLGFGALALALGQDANWNLSNYHWCNPHAFLTGRPETDLGAPGPYNPALEAPLYLGATLLPARVLSFLLGTVHGASYVLLYFLGRAVLAPLAEPHRTWAAAIALWPVTAQLRATIAVGVLTVATVTAWPGTRTRLPQWTEKMVEASVRALPDHTMVLMVGLELLSYVIPSLPPEVLALRRG